MTADTLGSLLRSSRNVSTTAVTAETPRTIRISDQGNQAVAKARSIPTSSTAATRSAINSTILMISGRLTSASSTIPVRAANSSAPIHGERVNRINAVPITIRTSGAIRTINHCAWRAWTIPASRLTSALPWVMLKMHVAPRAATVPTMMPAIVNWKTELPY